MFGMRRSYWGPFTDQDGGGTAGGDGQSAAAAGAANPPAKFNFGGKLVTFKEAEAMLKAADDLKAEYEGKAEYVTKLENSLKGAKAYKDNVASWLRNGDVNAAESVMRTHGYNDQQISAMKNALGGNGGRQTDDDDSDDDSDDRQRITPTRRNDGMSTEVAALKAQIAELNGAVQKMSQSQERWNQWGKNRWSQDSRSEIESALDSDEVVGPQLKNKKNQALAGRIRKIAIDEAMKQAEASGGLDSKIVKQAVATARTWVQDAGWLDAGANSAVPGVGDPMSIVTFGDDIKVQPNYKPKNDPTAQNAKEDFAHTLALAGQQPGPDFNL